MSKLARFVVFVTALMSLLGAVSATAGAVTWHNTGNTTYTATVTGGTLSGTGANGWACNSGGVITATVATGPFGGAIWAGETGTAKFSGCAGGTSNLNIDCSFTATASSWTALTPAVTHASADVTCGAWISSVNVCRVVGTLDSAATNPIGSTPGTVTSTTGGRLTLTNGTGGTCPLGSNDRGHLTVMQATITNGTGGSGSLGPIITRTS